MKKYLGTMLAILTALFALQCYFVRELLAAELFFAVGFVALLALGGLVYLVGWICERSLEFAEGSVRVVRDSVRRGFEGVSGKPISVYARSKSLDE